MSLVSRLRSFTRHIFRRHEVDNDLDDEIQSTLGLLTHQKIAQGTSPDDAHRAAQIELGGVEQLKEELRAVRTGAWLDSLLQDIRFALRMLRKNPGFTTVAVLTLALGIGVNTATFTVAKAILSDAMPVSHPDELRLLTWTHDARSAVEGFQGDFYSDGEGGEVTASFSYPVYQLLRRNHSLGDLFAFNVEGGGFDRATASIDGRAEIVVPELVSGNYFRALGVGVEIGRPIEPADDTAPGIGAVAVISDAFWTRRFGRSTSAIGKTVDLNLVPVTIIGVAPPGFGGASHAQISSDIFLPLSMQPRIFPSGDGPQVSGPSGSTSLLDDPSRWWVQVMGRLQPGISERSARASLAVTLDQAIRATITVPSHRTVPLLTLSPGGRGGLDYVAQDLNQPMWLLLLLAALVLLLACANIANLLLVRSAARQRELNVRLALGAGRARLLRQILTESVLLSSFGGAAGLLLAYFSRDVISRLLSPAWGPAEFATRFDWRVFAFALAVAVITGVSFGAAPAWRATQMNLTAGLKEGAASLTSRKTGLSGNALVIVQQSLCVMLLVSAGLFVRTLTNLRFVNPGFQADGLLLFGIAPPKQRYPSPKDIQVVANLEQRIAVLPGVESVTLSGEALLANSTAGAGFYIDGQPPKQVDEDRVRCNFVGRTFFRTMGIPVPYGRAFDSQDSATSQKVAVINQALARKFFGAVNPIGQTFRRAENDHDAYEIIGVSANAKYGWLQEAPPPTFYTFFIQEAMAHHVTFEVRTLGSPLGITGEIRSAVQSFDADLPLIDVRTQTEQIEATIAPQRIFASVTSGFGLLALILASIGVYGVTAYTVTRRINEIGIRVALGAQQRDILKMILGRGVSLTLVGITVGVSAAFALTRLAAAMLFGIASGDPAVYVLASIVLAFASFAACYIPARRAMRVDPMVALRHE